ncbi:hypothetical protein GCM10008171_14550 [Methylopila jiangsuensis]|uniref:DUF3551 domain-containing protein n=1 Tax=Methylopila jiangsuensis TaxID=586230 RepID=A0A9W6JEN7_9HYPH|nr:hypothetical protein [Methylopila jiangsuensis]MDR6284282.1 hypothetical protein [Methylopila jiangsuensis]GLK76201.1 hypothetical protein GCM10008171_14550 [Methylopila jiangsuensis]
MTRLAGRLMFALALQLLVTGGAAQAGHEAARRCEPVRVFKTPYKEQVCYAGDYGYAACRWIKRTYVVRVPSECVRPVLYEDAERISPRGRALSTKG